MLDGLALGEKSFSTATTPGKQDFRTYYFCINIDHAQNFCMY